MSDAASKETLSALHAALAKKFKEMLDGGEVTAADLNVIRAFLKDNNIDAAPKKGSPLGNLVDKLPFAGTEADDDLGPRQFQQ